MGSEAAPEAAPPTERRGRKILMAASGLIGVLALGVVQAVGTFYVPPLRQGLHELDPSFGVGHMPELGDGGIDLHGRKHFLVSSLMEEAIRSSQLEGASTTRAKAREMIRNRTPPRDRSERMILNNFHAMERIESLAEERNGA